MTLVVILLTLTGLVFFFATTIGILRFPDFYSRMHAAGKGDTLSSLIILLALVLYNFHDINLANLLVAIKILLIVVFIFMASPTATHAIIDAGYEASIKPWMKKPEEES
ncbi:MAG: monovalent cation/H(+) antiporter subunit G [Thermodesulfobacteriota bacterium]|jgi:multicomponent Na+:H+ antiporter subunit G